MPRKPCKDCGSTTYTVDRPGPRCAACHRAVIRRRRDAAHESRVAKFYGLGAGDYARLYAYQDGHCAICQRATGKARRLAVDHDHHAGCGHSAEIGCRSCVRGLLCKRCNRLLGHLHDSLAAAQRICDYLASPPAQRVFSEQHTVTDPSDVPHATHSR